MSLNENTIGEAVDLLLQRESSQEYKTEWINFFSYADAGCAPEPCLSVITFRLHAEWLALPTKIFKSIMRKRPIHTLPHRTHSILIGTVNIEGELQLCIALDKLLGIQQSTREKSMKELKHERLVAMNYEKQTWVFPVNEVGSVENWPIHLIENTPVNIVHSQVNYLKGVFEIAQKSVGLLDEELVFASLKRHV